MRETVAEFTPWEDEHQIESFVRLGDELWFTGAPCGNIGVFDFTKREIVFHEEWGYGAGHLQFREADGMLYAAMAGHVVRIDPATREHEVIATYPGLHRQIALTGEWLYAFTAMHLMRIKLGP